MEAHVAIAETISIDGGLTRSPYFIQFLADVIGRPLLIPDSGELTALGCAELEHRTGTRIQRVLFRPEL
jgi:glycerol kinase